MRSGTRSQLSQLIEKVLWTFKMFDDVKGQDVVEPLIWQLRKAFIQISKKEPVKFPGQSPSLHVASNNRALLEVFQCGPNRAHSRAEVEYPRSFWYQLDHAGMRAVKIEFRRISLPVVYRSAIEAPIVEQIDSLKPGLQGGFDDVEAVLQSLNTADLVSIICRYRDLLDLLACNDQLNDQLCIKVEYVRIPVEWNIPECSHRIYTEPAVEFG